VAAILTAGEEILVVKRSERKGDPWSGDWALPGGFWRSIDRDLLDTARRETIEEAGIDISGMRVLGWLRARRPTRLRWVEVFPLLLSTTSRVQARTSDEISDFRWVAIKDFLEKELEIMSAAGLQRVSAMVCGDVVVWGLTRGVLLEIKDYVASGLLP